MEETEASTEARTDNKTAEEDKEDAFPKKLMPRNRNARGGSKISRSLTRTKQQKQAPVIATSNLQTRKGEIESRNRNRTETAPTRTSQREEKHQRRGQTPTEEGKIFQPWPTSKETETRKDAEQEQDQKRKHATWADVGLIDYNPQTARWECRLEHYRQEMATSKSTYRHRKRNARNIASE